MGQTELRNDGVLRSRDAGWSILARPSYLFIHTSDSDPCYGSGVIYHGGADELRPLFREEGLAMATENTPEPTAPDTIVLVHGSG
jgi:hypothetical protein